MLIYYNKDLFDAAGVQYPDTLNETFDGLVDRAVKLTKASDTQFGYSGASAAHHIIIRSFGGDVLDADRKKSRLSEPEAIQATEWIHDLIYKYKAHPAPDEIQNGSDTNMFAGGKVAMLQNTLWTGTFLLPLIAGKFKYGAAVLPKGPTGVMGNHSQSDLVGVTANSKNPDVAWQIAKFMTARDIGIEKVSLNAGGPGARPDAQSDPGLNDKMIGLKEFQAVLKEGRKPFPEPKPWNVRAQELNDAFGQNTDPIWLDKVTPADGMKKVNDAAQKVLDKPRP
jgi:multiple sugar transport system substrate-binding protein